MRHRIRKLLPGHEAISDNRWLRPFAGTLLHPRLWHLNRHSVAGGVAAGLFCGLIPGPLQMLGAALCAVLFRVNLPLAMLTTLYTNPLTIVPIYLLAYQLGRWLIQDDLAFTAPPAFAGQGLEGWSEAMLTWMLTVARPLGWGLVLLGLVLAVAGYVSVQAGWRIHLMHRWRSRRQQRGRRPGS